MNERLNALRGLKPPRRDVESLVGWCEEMAKALDKELEYMASRLGEKSGLGVSGTFLSADSPAKKITVKDGVVVEIK